MELAIEHARKTMNQGLGGPFGAAVEDLQGSIICVASNLVLSRHDPTAHAEINAIREAGRILGTHDLSGCTLYTSCYPCPMCLGAIIWANIKTVWFGCRPEDAAAIGFRDDFMYSFIRDGCKDASTLMLKEQDRDSCLKLFSEYTARHSKIY